MADVAAANRFGGQKRQPNGCGLQAQADGKIRVLFNLDRVRYGGFGRPPVVVTEAGGDIADPRGDDLFYSTGADQLVELHV